MSRRFKLILTTGLAVAGLLAGSYLTVLALGNKLLNVSTSSTDAGHPAIAVDPDGQKIGMVWAERYSGGGAAQGPIILKAALNGTNITVRQVVDNANNVDDQSTTPDIAVDSTNALTMHLVWKNLAGNKHTIFYIPCIVTGNCTTGHQEVASVTGSSAAQVADPAVAVNPAGVTAGVHVVWQEINDANTQRVIKYRGKRAGDSSFSGAPAAFTLSDSSTTYAFHPAIAVSKDQSGSNTYVHVAWAADTSNPKDGVNDVIQYRRGQVDNATGVVSSWDAIKPLPVPVPTHLNPDYPAVTAGSGMVFVAWDVQKGNTASPGDGDDIYLAVYSVSNDNGSNFTVKFANAVDVGTDNSGSFDYTDRRSDENPFNNSNTLRSSDHARRLQLQATFVTTTTSGITGTLHVVWHQTDNFLDPTTYKHDVNYSARRFTQNDAIGCGGPCEWSTPVANNKNNNPLDNSVFYSMQPDIAVDRFGKTYVVYMESKNPDEYDIVLPGNDLKVVDIIFNGTQELKDNTRNVYLPIIMKLAS
jgi:hypothetical protein